MILIPGSMYINLVIIYVNLCMSSTCPRCLSLDGSLGVLLCVLSTRGKRVPFTSFSPSVCGVCGGRSHPELFTKQLSRVRFGELLRYFGALSSGPEEEMRMLKRQTNASSSLTEIRLCEAKLHTHPFLRVALPHVP